MTLDPGAAIQTTENALRQLMTAAYYRAFGAAWLERVATPKMLEEWQKRRLEEEKSRNGLASVPGAGLGYSNFYDLVEIAKKYWQPLAPALGRSARTMPLLLEAAELAQAQADLEALEEEEFKRTQALLEEMKSMRNTVAHGRTLYPHEIDLLSGIAGRIRNQVTIYMSSVDDAGDIYPRIESALDNLGHELEIASAENEIAGYINSKIVLYPGQELEFTLTGFDPQGRDLEWIVDKYPADTIARTKSGEPATLSYVVTDDDVRESWYLSILMRTVGTPYHRHGSMDQRVYWSYAVRPAR